MRPSTTFAGASPFTPVICDDAMPGRRAKVVSKYAPLFSELKHGQAIKCSKADRGLISAALRNHVRAGHIEGVVHTTRDFGDGFARVWLSKGKTK